MSSGPATVGAVATAAALFLWFVRLERNGRGATVVYFVLGLVIFESTLYPDPNTVPTGIFHPGQGALSFRLQDLVIPVALLARLLARGAPRRLDAAGAWWLAFLAWIGCFAFLGMIEGNPVSLAAFEAKVIVYVGAFALVAGVPLEHLVDVRRLSLLVRWSAIAAVIVCSTQLVGVSVTAGLPLVPLAEFGHLGADAATVLATIGILALTMGLTRESGRWTWMLAAAPLLAAPVASKQRAAMLGTLVALAVVGIALLVSRRRLRATPTELALTSLAVVGLLIGPYVVGVALSPKATSIPLAHSLDVALTSRSKQLSAESRVNQLRAVKHLIVQRPVFGWGLGQEYTFYDPGPKRVVTTNLTHNIVTDLLLRTGLVGLACFLVAVGSTVLAGVARWRIEADPQIAAFVLACTAALVGLIAKGLVESIFEKYRLAALLGLLVGGVLAGAARRRATVADPELSPQPA